jgi:hypothetical protein
MDLPSDKEWAELEEALLAYNEYYNDVIEGCGTSPAQDKEIKEAEGDLVLFAVRFLRDALRDAARLNWLEANSYAFLFNHNTGKGNISLSTSYGDPFPLRNAIDEAARKMKENDNEAMP